MHVRAATTAGLFALMAAGANGQTACDDLTGTRTPIENLAFGFGSMPPIEGDVDISALLGDPVFGPWAMGNMACLGCGGGAAGLVRRRQLQVAEDEVDEMAIGMAVLSCAGIAPLDTAGMAALTEPACGDTEFGIIAQMSAGGRRLQMDALNEIFATVIALGNQCSSCYFGFAGAAASGDVTMTMAAANACFGPTNTALMFPPPPTQSPTQPPTAMTVNPTMSPTESPKREVELVLSVTFDEEVTKAEAAEICDAAVAQTAQETGVDEKEFTCSLDRLASAYELILTMRVPKTDTEITAEVVTALASSLKSIPELEGSAVSAVAFTDGEEEPYVFETSGSSKHIPSLIVGFCLAIMQIQ